MTMKFQKMHGAGNDFVLLDLRNQNFDINPRVAQDLADRHTGIGCDQLLVLRPPDNNDAVARYEIWNADGTTANQCGNGMRCIGLYLMQEQGDSVLLDGPSGQIQVEALADGMFRVNMGAPEFAAHKIPVRLPHGDYGYELVIGTERFNLGAVSVGNPHVLMEVDDLETTPVSALGAKIGAQPAFPEGVNVGFAQIVATGEINLKVYERGAGLTRSCGSGACAAAVILMQNGKISEQVLVNQVGGSLIIEWQGDRAPVMMTGQAIHLYEGNLL